MKKLVTLFCVILTFCCKAQITLEHVYDSASTEYCNYPMMGSPSENSQLMIINFEISGERYVKINRWGEKIEIYSMNHSLIKAISIATLPKTSSSNGKFGDFLYISEQLFDLDSLIEYMYCVHIGSKSFTGIYNEDGICIFSDTAGPIIRSNIPVQQLPIYNTAYGTKMILSYLGITPDVTGFKAKVFSLPGTLTVGIAQANNILVSQSYISNPYPNPSSSSTKIDYTLPPGINEGEIVFYNLQGTEVKRFKVDKTFSTLLVSTADIAAGTYLYQLQTSGMSTEGKKMVVIK